jgi:hypothetical protein
MAADVHLGAPTVFEGASGGWAYALCDLPTPAGPWLDDFASQLDLEHNAGSINAHLEGRFVVLAISLVDAARAAELDSRLRGVVALVNERFESPQDG